MLRSTARARGAAEHTSTATSSGTLTIWKALKRSCRARLAQRINALAKGKGKARSKSHSFSRFAVSSSFLRALFGGPSSTVGPNVNIADRPGAAASPLVNVVRRCGRVVKRKQPSWLCLLMPRPARSQIVPGKPVQDGRTNADQLLSKPCSMLALRLNAYSCSNNGYLATTTSLFDTVKSSDLRSLSELYLYIYPCFVDANRRAPTNGIASSSMVRTALNHRSSFLCELTQICFFWYRDAFTDL